MTPTFHDKLYACLHAGNDETENISGLAIGVKDLLEKSDDPYIKVAVQAIDKKTFKHVDGQYMDGLMTLFKAAQIVRLARVAEILKDISFTYKDLKSYSRWHGFMEYTEQYSPNVRGFLIPETAKNVFVADMLAGLASNYNIHLENQDIKTWIGDFAPKKFTVNDVYLNVKQKIIKKIEDVNGLKTHELSYAGSVFAAVKESLDQVASSSDFRLSAEEIGQLNGFAQSIQDNAACLISFLEDVNSVSASVLADCLKVHLNHLTSPNGLVTLLTDYQQSYQNQQRSAHEYETYQAVLSNHGFINVFNGEEYVHLRPHTREEEIISAVLNEKMGGDKTEKSAELNEIYNEAAAINRKIAYLKSPLVEDVPKPYSINKTMDDLTALAERLSLDVEQRMYCTLKQSGQYGEANLMAAFIAAVQARSDANDADAAPRQNPTAYLNELLKADLMMHGWGGEMPDAWREEATPSAADLVWMRNHPFTWLAPNDTVKPTLSAAEMDIEHDMNHRKTYFAKLIGYLQKARPMVGAKAQAEIDYGLTQLREEIIPAYQNALSDDHTHTENTNTEKGCTLS